jgi:hypothetical protein
MSEPNKENLGLDWLDRMVEQFRSEPIFEDPKWDRVMAELGRITVYFDMLSFNLKGLLVTLERPQDLTMNTSSYAHTGVKKVIEKCETALQKLEATLAGKKPILGQLFQDCRQQLESCDQLRNRRNELIHALWFPQAFQADLTTQLQMTQPTKPGGLSEIVVRERSLSELRATVLEIRNAIPPLHVVTVKLRVAFQHPTA